MAWGFQDPGGHRWLELLPIWAGKSRGQLSLDTSHHYRWGLGAHLPALSGTTPRILITVPTRMPSGREVLWGTFCRTSGAGTKATSDAEDRDRWVSPRQKRTRTQIS